MLHLLHVCQVSGRLTVSKWPCAVRKVLMSQKGWPPWCGSALPLLATTLPLLADEVCTVCTLCP